MIKRKLVSFSLDEHTIAIITKLAQTRTGDNVSKAVRLMAQEWDQDRKVASEQEDHSGAMGMGN